MIEKYTSMWLLTIGSILFGFSAISYAKGVDTLEHRFQIGGMVSFQRFSEVPMIVSSTKNGPWQVDYIKNMPYSKSTAVSDITCVNKFCTAVGFYEPYSTALVQKPLMLVGNDDTWSFVDNIIDMPNVNFGSFTSVYCTSKTCIAGGFYDNFNSQQPPILIVSGKGQSWSRVKQIKEPEDVRTSSITSVNCLNDNICFAVGNYIKSDNKLYALLLASTDGGKSWAQSLPQKEAKLTSITCNKNTCLATGAYTSGKDKPILLKSNDQGQNWQEYNSYPSQVISGELSKVSCNNKVCQAIGTYASNERVLNPLVLISQDAGNTWRLTKDATNLPLMQYLVLHNSTCNESSCQIVGDYNTGNRSQPLLMNVDLKDPDLKLTHNTSYNFLQGDSLLHVVNCKENECVAAGESRGAVNERYPLVIVSKDGGKTWDRSMNIPNMHLGMYSNFNSIR